MTENGHQSKALRIKACGDEYYLARYNNYTFVQDQSRRRRLRRHLLRKLRKLVEEFAVCVGQQVVLIDYYNNHCTSSTANEHREKFYVYGAQPLKCIIENLAPWVMNDLQNCLKQLPNNSPISPSYDQAHGIQGAKSDLPIISITEMKQTELRSFIPVIIKYTTGRRKIGWGCKDAKPHWWPPDIPWRNIKSDHRDDFQKAKVPWTEALRNIVSNCYRYYYREDLLHYLAKDANNADQNQNLLNNSANDANDADQNQNHSLYVDNSQTDTSVHVLPIAEKCLQTSYEITNANLPNQDKSHKYHPSRSIMKEFKLDQLRDGDHQAIHRIAIDPEGDHDIILVQ
ncbi:DNA-binding protein P3A2, partial [Trichoplax sp. H2]